MAEISVLRLVPQVAYNGFLHTVNKAKRERKKQENKNQNLQILKWKPSSILGGGVPY